MFDVEIINTGSDGNAIMIDDCILIDFGLAYKHVGEYMDKADAIIITHRHGDHFHLQAFKMYVKRNGFKARNVLYMNRDVAQTIDEKLKNDKIQFVPKESNILKTHSFEYSNLVTYELITRNGKYKLEIFKLIHDVENQGLILTNENGDSLLYATDTETMRYAPVNRTYDVIMLEGNYDDAKITDALTSLDETYTKRALRNLRHLSLEKFETFVEKHKKENTKVYQLHVSSEFGTLSQLHNIENYDDFKK